MSLMMEVALKTTALFACGWLVVALLRSRSAAVRHRVLALTFACAIAAPTLVVLAPVWYLPVPSTWLNHSVGSQITITSAPAPAGQAALDGVPTGAQSTAHAALDATTLVGAIWLVGCVVSVGIVIIGLWRARRLGRHARPLETGPWRECADDIAHAYGLRRRIRLLHSAHPTMLVTWGLVQPRILVPASAIDWSEDRIRIVLWHELAHVMRCDWPVLIAAGVLRAVHWFNPLVWIAYRRLRQESEQASDDLVLQRGVAAADYASHLLAVARDTVSHRHAAAAIAIAHPSTLEGRVRAMLNARANRTPLSAIGRWSATAVAAVTTMVITGAGVSTFATPVPARIAPGAAGANSAASRVSAAPAAQTGPGTITGVLYDQLGGLLPGATVTLTQRPDGARYETVSDRNGAFTFSLLPPGNYELGTSLAGFANVTNFINVEAGAKVERRITMPIGTLQETIGVTGGGGNSAQRRQGYPNYPQAPLPESRTLFSGGIGGQIRVPTKVVHVSPIYPSNVGRVSDTVMLTGRVGIDGFITDLQEVNPATSTAKDAHPAFVSSAIEAVSQWRFTPTLLNNVPVEANITIRIDYAWQ